MMRYFLNPLNRNKYEVDTIELAGFLIRLGYNEINKKEYDELEDIF